MKKVAILQSNYIPWKGYFDLINMVDEFIIYDEMQYTRRDWRNRNKIKTVNGTKWLSIPVEVKGRYYQKINETRISDPNWGGKHWRTIVHAYRSAPFFEMYSDELENLYHDKLDLLSDVNYQFIKLINKFLGIDTKITFSSDYVLDDGKTERLVSLCKQANATEYISGPAARDYIDETLFAQQEIALSWMDYSDYPEYPQIHPPFEHGVTILDLIFSCGPNAVEYMKSF